MQIGYCFHYFFEYTYLCNNDLQNDSQMRYSTTESTSARSLSIATLAQLLTLTLKKNLNQRIWYKIISLI